jgi:hypothetical protein
VLGENAPCWATITGTAYRRMVEDWADMGRKTPQPKPEPDTTLEKRRTWRRDAYIILSPQGETSEHESLVKAAARMGMNRKGLSLQLQDRDLYRTMSGWIIVRKMQAPPAKIGG